ncbi:MAG: class III extradiol ring-cleavage dioxygenase [Pseudomonadota bacterium]|nr:class III extradiol ring-cleavage dioxygenase [Pseudomonadota bacterium]
MPLGPLFISHGAPDVLTTPSPAHAALRALGLAAGTRAVAVISAHWEAEPVRVQSGATPETIHDFRGFGPGLERALYAAPGSPSLAARTLALLREAGIEADADRKRGRDHGAWIPLALMRPEADIPLFQISLPRSDARAIALGRALAPLARDGVQIIGSGSLTHSLRAALGAPEAAPPHPGAKAFRDWIAPKIATGDAEALTGWPDAPQAGFNHPTPEHFRPLLTAMAAGNGGRAELLHQSWSRGALAMDIWRF